jgi:hypothetical protein
LNRVGNKKINMKRFFWFLLLMGSVSCLYYCSKSVGLRTDAHDEQNGEVGQRMAAAEIATVSKQGGTVCNCTATQLSCRADCYLSDCCICWNPTIDNGSCGCYFGVAKCITGPVGKSTTYRKVHPVKLYTTRFAGFLDQLQFQMKDADSLRSRFNALISIPGMAIVKDKDPYVEVPTENYLPFFDYYTAFMQKATPEVQHWVIEFMNARATGL